MGKFTKFMLTFALLVAGVEGVNAKDYHPLGGQSQNGWSWGFTETTPTSGVVAFKLTNLWATFGLMGGLESISVTDYPNWKVYFEGKSPTNCHVTYSLDGSAKYVGGGGQAVASGSFGEGTSVTGFCVQCTSEAGCVVVVRDVVFYNQDEASGIHPTYQAPSWGGSCITKSLSYSNKYGVVYVPELDNAVNKMVTIKAGTAFPDGLNLYYRFNGAEGPERWISLSGKTEHSEAIVGTIYAIGIQCGVDASGESPIVAENVTVYSEDLPTVTYADPVSETSLNTLTYYSNGEPNTPEWNIGSSNGTIYGKGDTGQNAEYVDLDDYDELRIYQTAGDPVRVFMWNNDMSGIVTINTSSNPVSLTLVDDYYKLDLAAVRTNYGHAYLNAIKASAYNTQATVSGITVTSESVTVDCILKGDASYGLLSDEATVALNNGTYTAIDVTKITNGSELTLVPENPNCLFIANSATTIANTNNVIVDGTCANLVLTDGKPFKAPAAFTATNASFSKTVTDAGYATLVIPFGAALPTGVEAYNLTAVDGTAITSSSADAITADQPVMIKAAAGDYEFTAAGAEIAATPAEPVQNGLLYGVYSTTDVPTGTSYVLQKHDTEVNFYKAASGQKVNAFCAYLTANAGARLSFNFDDATGIEAVKKGDVTTTVYNLNGQSVAAPQKGLYIVNGKKVIVK